MDNLKIICSVAYIIFLIVFTVFLEKRLRFLHQTNISKVPAEDSKALSILHSRLKLIIRFLLLFLLFGGIFIILILL